MIRIEYIKKTYWDKKRVRELATNVIKKRDSFLWKKICCKITQDKFLKIYLLLNFK